jgi:hypothetical protein
MNFVMDACQYPGTAVFSARKHCIYTDMYLPKVTPVPMKTCRSTYPLSTISSRQRRTRSRFSKTVFFSMLFLKE